ncbi:MAG: SRPBCC family protein [Sphingobacteriales bacterium]|nr:SRPBCC family protein [Sphingobacteriales bacterium]
MTFEYTNPVKCTKQEAWNLIADLERRPDWIHFQEKCYWTDKKPGMVGSRYQEKEVFLGFPLNVNYEITVWKEFEQVSSICLMPPFHQTVDVIVKENASGVICSLIIDLKIGVLGLLPKSIIKRQVDNLVQPLVDQFIKILETESVLNKK